MFWGVTLECGKRYSQTVDQTYHLSMAALEPPADGKKPQKYVSLMIEHEKSEYLICTLEYEKKLQVKLDHVFVEGEEVTFFLNGDGTVHLTGYVIDDGGDYDELDEEEEIGDEESDEDEEEDDDDDVPKLNAISMGKRKKEKENASPEKSILKKMKVEEKRDSSPAKTAKPEERTATTAISNAKNIKEISPVKGNAKIDDANVKEDEESDDSEEDEEEDEAADNDLGLLDKEAIEADDSEEDEEESDEDEESGDSSDNDGKDKNKQKNKGILKDDDSKKPQQQQSPNQNVSQNQQNKFGGDKKQGFQQRGQFDQQKGQFGNQRGGGRGRGQFGHQRGRGGGGRGSGGRGGGGRGGQQKWQGQRGSPGGDGSPNKSPFNKQFGDGNNQRPKFDGNRQNRGGQQRGQFTPNQNRFNKPKFDKKWNSDKK